MTWLLPLLKLLFVAILPALVDLKEKTREAVEIVPDPGFDDFFDGEWVS